MLGRSTSFFFKYADPFLRSRPGALDAASALFFLGKKSNHALSDKELVASYKGAMQ